MKNPILRILEFFRVKKTMRFHGSLEKLERLLETMITQRRDKEDFYVQKIADKKYLLEPTISLGTMQVSVGSKTVHTEGIGVTMELVPVSDQLQEIRLTGTLHKGHIAIMAVFVFFIILFSALVAKETIVPLFFVIPLWGIFHAWFNFVWTSQEKALIDEVKLALHIRIKARIGL